MAAASLVLHDCRINIEKVHEPERIGQNVACADAQVIFEKCVKIWSAPSEEEDFAFRVGLNFGWQPFPVLHGQVGRGHSAHEGVEKTFMGLKPSI